ncbi:MAG: fused MFS/spermidine synthase [Pseudomonadota bacterium]
MILYVATIFLSAFLLFQVQPLIAKLILPWFGGSAAVWTICMLFFQVLLLAGYMYAHGLARLRSRSLQRLLHCVLLAACLAVLPLEPGTAWKPAGGDKPTWLILGLLATSVGLPYFMLSTTGPLVQVWYARTHTGAMPYRLFALSNFGSLFALLSYPLLIEPWLSSRWQTWTWSACFGLFALFCGVLAWKAPGRASTAHAETHGQGEVPGLGLKTWWAALACCASTLLLAFTSHLSLNIAPLPFLWVLPLALYLASFIVCFEAPHWYRRDVWFPLLAAGLVGVCYTLWPGHDHEPLSLLLPVYALTLFCACMVCHGELARSKPGHEYLTGFYLMLALGGALGGVFVGLIAPRLFDDLYELPLGLFALALLVCAALYRDRHSILHGRVALPARDGLVVLVAALAAVLNWEYGNLADRSRVAMRNFYAVLKVKDYGAGEQSMRELTHGTIMHGSQFLAPDRRDWPTTYYGPLSGVGLAIKSAGAGGSVRIGVVGLGAGTLASYGRPGDVIRFYEINPQVVELARSEFSFLRDSKARIEIAMGDARLSLDHEGAQQFNVLVLDAFSSDSIPVHLLTLEAFRIYARHLNAGGILALHISNHYLDLVPVVVEAARLIGLDALRVKNEDDEKKGVSASDWMLLSASPDAFKSKDMQQHAAPVEAATAVRAWTDDYSDVFGILK